MLENHADSHQGDSHGRWGIIQHHMILSIYVNLNSAPGVYLGRVPVCILSTQSDMQWSSGATFMLQWLQDMETRCMAVSATMLGIDNDTEYANVHNSTARWAHPCSHILDNIIQGVILQGTICLSPICFLQSSWNGKLSDQHMLM